MDGSNPQIDKLTANPKFLDLTKPAGAPKVLIASPSSGSSKDAFTESMFHLFGHVGPEVAMLMRKVCRGSNIAENQNTLVDLAREKQVDYILLAETDVAFPKDGLNRLLAHDKDIIGASTQYKEHDILAANIAGSPRLPRYMGYELDGTEITLNSLAQAEEPIRKVAGIPMGFTLLKLSAVDAVSREIARMDGHDGDMFGPPFCHRNAYLPGRSRAIVSTTDMTFCGVARAIGLDVWLDARLSLQMEHIGEMNFGVLPPMEGQSE